MNAEHDTRDDAVVTSSGNVFADLGLPSSEEDMLKVKIAHAIVITLGKRKLTQSEAARIIGTDQAKVSALFRGQLKGFSVDRLIQYLVALGRDVDIHISRRLRKEPGRIRVNAA